MGRIRDGGVTVGTRPAGLARWNWRSLFSYELAFALLCFAGAFKGASFFVEMRPTFDLTIFLMVGSLVVGAGSMLTRPRAPLVRTKAAALFIGVYFALILYASISYLLGDGGEDATRKIQRVLVFDTWFLLGAMIGMNTRERICRFLNFIVLLGVITAVASA